ncbi:MAG: hypothetical protein [Siphoviridae sp. ctjeG17]|nr:MAG: hypothetical protein [Siphoviridae sp. ctjeG17]
MPDDSELYNFSINLHITYQNGEKAIELRKRTINKQVIKQIIWSALRDQPILIFPTFTNKPKAICRLIEEKIIEYDKEEGKYYFLIDE